MRTCREYHDREEASRLASRLEELNRERALVYTTIQMDRVDRPAYLAALYDRSTSSDDAVLAADGFGAYFNSNVTNHGSGGLAHSGAAIDDITLRSGTNAASSSVT